jgi:hypothetical protein
VWHFSISSQRASPNVVSSLQFLVILVMEKIRSYETSVLTRATWRGVPEDGILRSQRQENVNSYISLKCYIPAVHEADMSIA